MNRNARRLLRLGSGVLLALAVTLTASAGWIHAKALVAQVLLERAWDASDAGRNVVKPWPSADMAPIAKLVFARQHESFIVLDKDSGQALAFGPGWTPTSARPATRGLTIISAHRDTQFSALRHVRQGDVVTVSSAGLTRSYRVSRTQVVDATRTRLGGAESADALILVTCYPFDAIVPGGPLRYVVTALPATPPA